MLWNVESLKPVRAPRAYGYPHLTEFSPDGKQLWFADHGEARTEAIGRPGAEAVKGPTPPSDGVHVYWTPTARTWLRRADPKAARKRINENDIQRQVKVQTVDAATKKVVREFTLEGHFVQASPDGQFLLTAHGGINPLIVTNSIPPPSPAGPWMVWDAATGRKCCDLTEGTDDPIGLRGMLAMYGHTPQIFSPDGRLLAWHGSTGTIVTELRTGRKVARIAPSTASFSALSADGKTLAGADGNHVVLCELATGTIRAAFAGHDAPVAAVRFGPDGLLASSSYDGTVIVWDLFGKKRAKTKERLTETELAAAWNALARTDAKTAHEAAIELGQHPGQAIPYLRDRIAAHAETAWRDIKPLIKALDNTQFAVRDQADRKLRAHGALAIPALEAALRQPVSPELRRRVEGLLQAINTSPSGPGLQAYRGLEVLERLRAADALEQLQTGDDANPIAMEAKLCRQRVKGRP
jgi:hypothetical protein